MVTKLTLKAYDRKKNPIGAIDPFSVMVNPETISVDQAIEYVPLPWMKTYQIFAGYSQIGVEIPAIILDATGAIPKENWPEGCNTVLEMIAKLEKVVYGYRGNEHEPPIVSVQWGAFLYWTKLTSMDVKYTMFDGNGKPVRAEVTLKLLYYRTIEEIIAALNKSSPDLTHYVEVLAGDTLPLMCQRVYKDSSLYLQVARVNHLTNFRSLKPGTRLYFPPLVD